jgi:hypothetical protein
MIKSKAILTTICIICIDFFAKNKSSRILTNNFNLIDPKWSSISVFGDNVKAALNVLLLPVIPPSDSGAFQQTNKIITKLIKNQNQY